MANPPCCGGRDLCKPSGRVTHCVTVTELGCHRRRPKRRSSAQGYSHICSHQISRNVLDPACRGLLPFAALGHRVAAADVMLDCPRHVPGHCCRPLLLPAHGSVSQLAVVPPHDRQLEAVPPAPRSGRTRGPGSPICGSKDLRCPDQKTLVQPHGATRTSCAHLGPCRLQPLQLGRSKHAPLDRN